MRWTEEGGRRCFFGNWTIDLGRWAEHHKESFHKERQKDFRKLKGGMLDPREGDGRVSRWRVVSSWEGD